MVFCRRLEVQVGCLGAYAATKVTSVTILFDHQPEPQAERRRSADASRKVSPGQPARSLGFWVMGVAERLTSPVSTIQWVLKPPVKLST